MPVDSGVAAVSSFQRFPFSLSGDGADHHGQAWFSASHVSARRSLSAAHSARLFFLLPARLEWSTSLGCLWLFSVTGREPSPVSFASEVGADERSPARDPTPPKRREAHASACALPSLSTEAGPAPLYVAT